MLIATPGKIARYGAVSRFLRPSPLSIAPHVGVGGGVPSPRKLRAASMTMAFPSHTVAMTRIGANTFGRMCRATIRPGETPRSLGRVDERVLLDRQHGAPHDARAIRGCASAAVTSVVAPFLEVTGFDLVADVALAEKGAWRHRTVVLNCRIDTAIRNINPAGDTYLSSRKANSCRLSPKQSADEFNSALRTEPLKVDIFNAEDAGQRWRHYRASAPALGRSNRFARLRGRHPFGCSSFALPLLHLTC
jgi:hypothetical protein